MEPSSGQSLSLQVFVLWVVLQQTPGVAADTLLPSFSHKSSFVMLQHELQQEVLFQSLVSVGRIPRHRRPLSTDGTVDASPLQLSMKKSVRPAASKASGDRGKAEAQSATSTGKPATKSSSTAPLPKVRSQRRIGTLRFHATVGFIVFC